ncbi:hypothetical protein SHKM778_01640 [Streptomyces sp. KM77-8]|uniref:Uncharacterized protein n=1 Tax=Streptomyces haneummycinicus TaxID=3074435 RepID=A0AAT9H8Q6_9ACTN
MIRPLPSTAPGTEHSGVPRGPSPDVYAAGAAVLLVTAAVLVGHHIQGTSRTLFADWPPLLASWEPHLGPGTPAAVLVAVATVAYGPALAARLPWRALIPLTWGTAMAWTWSLALVDGWQRGIAGRLTTRHEYLQVIDRFHDIPAALRGFTRHILLGSPTPGPPTPPATRPEPRSPSSCSTGSGCGAGAGPGRGASPSGRRPAWPCWSRSAPWRTRDSREERRPSSSWPRPPCGWAPRPTRTSRRWPRGRWRCSHWRSPDGPCGGRGHPGCCSAWPATCRTASRSSR